MSEIFFQILDPARTAIFNKLSALKNKVYLAGGTALALQLNHRLSLDFDLFSEKPLGRYFYREIQGLFGPHFETIRKSGNQISLLTEKGIKVDFVHYWYPRLTQTIKTSSVDLASIQDIAADKASTLGHRGQWRDYVDLFVLIKEKILPLEKIMGLAKKKFGGQFNEVLFLEQLVYFEDLQISKTRFLKKKYSEKQIKDCLGQEVSRFLKKELPQIGRYF